MKVAQLGAGRIGVMHAELLADLLDDGELVVADAAPERAMQVAGRLGVASTGIEEAIATADAMVIAASSTAHPELIRAGLTRGIPIFCEKPLATGREATRQIVEEIESSGVPFQL